MSLPLLWFMLGTVAVSKHCAHVSQSYLKYSSDIVSVICKMRSLSSGSQSDSARWEKVFNTKVLTFLTTLGFPQANGAINQPSQQERLKPNRIKKTVQIRGRKVRRRIRTPVKHKDIWLWEAAPWVMLACWHARQLLTWKWFSLFDCRESPLLQDIYQQKKRERALHEYM